MEFSFQYTDLRGRLMSPDHQVLRRPNFIGLVRRDLPDRLFTPNLKKKVFTALILAIPVLYDKKNTWLPVLFTRII